MSLVTVSQAQGRVPVTILHTHDRLNLGNVAQLEQAAREAYAGGARMMVLDLAEVPSVTSAGLRAILAIYKLLGGEAAEAQSGAPWKSTTFKISGVTPAVREVLDVAGFDEYIELHADVPAAVASF